MELEGKISVVMPAMSGVSQSTGNQWMSQEYVIAYYWFPNQTNPSYIVMKAFGEDRIKQFNLQPNDEVRVRYHVEAHEYNGRWYNDTRLDAVTFVGASASKNQQPANQPAQPSNTQEVGQQPAQPNQGQQEAPFPPKVDANGNPVNNDGNDDLPF
jgi:hypothetical protein